MTGAGELDRRIRFERQGPPIDDGTTRQPGDWAEWCKAWAKVNYGRGDERRAAAQENAGVPATFRVRASTETDAVTVKDRIVFDGAAWDITSNVPFGRFFRDVTAKRAG